MGASSKTPEATPATAKKGYRALTNILGEPVTNADAASRAIAPHKLYRKDSIIPLGEKDADRLLEIKAVEPIK